MASSQLKQKGKRKMKKIALSLFVGALVFCGVGCKGTVSEKTGSDTSVVVSKDTAKVDTVKKDTTKVDTSKKVLVKPISKAPAKRTHKKAKKDSSKVVKVDTSKTVKK